MRLSKLQINIIKNEVANLFSNSAKVYLFGSRTNNNAKGGDIDLLIEFDKKKDNLYRNILTLNRNIQKQLGEQKIDIISIYPGKKTQDIHKEAIKTGIPL